MGIIRKDIIRALRWLAGIMFAFLVLGPLNEWSVELARELGAYKHPVGVLTALAQFFWFAGTWWFQWIAALVIGGAAGMWADDRWRKIEHDKARPLKPEEIRRLGQDLVELSGDMFRFLAERSAENVTRRVQSPRDPTDIHSWQADRDYEQVTGSQFLARFGARALGALGRLQHLGIKMPPHMVTTAQYGRGTGMAQFIGLMGNLLATGELERAIELSQDRNFIWQIEH